MKMRSNLIFNNNTIYLKGLLLSWENIYQEHRSSTMRSRAKCGMSEIGVDIIGTLFSADYIGESKHAENIVRDHANDRRTGRVSYDRFPIPLAPIKETHVRRNFEFFKCSFADSFHMYVFSLRTFRFKLHL